MKRDAASGGPLREPGLEVKLQCELKNARIANGAGKDSERGSPECGAGGSEVRMIEHVEKLRTERKTVFFRDGEFLAEIHVPVLLEGPTVNVPAEIAEERAAAGAYREGLIPWATEDVEARNDRAGRQRLRRSQDVGVKYAVARKVFRTTALDEGS
jgi:hypothetical protein